MKSKSYYIDFEIKGIYNDNKYGYPDPLNPKYYEFCCHTSKALEYAKSQFGLDCELNKRIHITSSQRNEIYSHLHNQKLYSLILS